MSATPSQSAPRRFGLREAFVLLAWLACVFDAARFVAHYGSALPAMDDLELPALLDLGWPEFLRASWQPANEHRMVAPYFAMRVLLTLFGDFRAPLACVLACYALAALLMLALARGLRGHSHPLDALFALLVLHMGNAENLLLGCQIGTALPLLLVGLWCAAVCLGEAPIGRLRASCMGAALVLLPLNGSWGLVQAFALAPATLALGVLGRRSSEPATRAAGVRCLAAGALGLAAIGAYFIDYQPSNRGASEHSLALLAPIAAQVLSLNLGPGNPLNSSAACWAAAALVLSGLVCCARAAWRSPAQRARAIALGAALCGGGALALAIGWGRQDAWPSGGFALRYCTASAWAVASALLAWIAFAPRALGLALGAGWLAWMLAAHGDARAVGHSFGQMHRRRTQGLAADVEAGVPLLAIAQRWRADFYPSTLEEAPEGALYERLRELWKLRLPPFAGRLDPPPLLPFAAQLALQPLGLEVVWLSARSAPELYGEGAERALAIACPSEVCLRVPRDWRALALACGGPRPMQCTLELRAADGSVLARAEQPVDTRETHAPRAFELRWQQEAALLLLRCELSESGARPARAAWHSIRQL